MKIRWYTVIIFNAKIITKQVFKQLIYTWEMGKFTIYNSMKGKRFVMIYMTV